MKAALAMLVVMIVSTIGLAAEGFKTDKRPERGFKSDQPTPAVHVTPEPEIVQARTIRLVPPVSSTFEADAPKPFESLTYCSPSCLPCQAMKTNFPKGNSKLVMKYTNDEAPDISQWVNGRWIVGPPPSLPCTIWSDGKGRSTYLLGYATPDQIVEKILKNNPPFAESSAIPSASLPSIDDSGLIGEAIRNLITYAGQDATIHVELTRKGAKQTLLATETHSIEDILGKSCHLVITLKSPSRKINFRHEMDFVPAELVAMFKSNDGKVGSPFLIAWTIASIAQTVYDILHPQISLYLPETIVIDGKFADDKTAALSFGAQPPKVQLLWKFWYGILQYEANRPLTGMKFDSVAAVVEFHQSRIYRDLTLPIRSTHRGTIDDGSDGPGIDETAEQIEQPMSATDSRRSPKWSALRNRFLADHPACCVCGAKSTTVHHAKPFHLFPALELEESNLRSMCDRCHLLIGHLGNFQNYNPDIDKHIKTLNAAKVAADIERKSIRSQTPSKTELAP